MARCWRKLRGQEGSSESGGASGKSAPLPACWHSRSHLRPDRLLLLYSCFADVDVAVEIFELNVLASAVDGSTDGLINSNAVLSALSSVVFHGLMRSRGLKLHIKVTEDLAVVRAHADGGFQSGGKVTSISPLRELNAMGFCGLTRTKVASTLLFKAWATALPEMLLSVTGPFTLSTSSSPSTPVTVILPSFTLCRESEVRIGTVMFKSTARLIWSVDTRTGCCLRPRKVLCLREYGACRLLRGSHSSAFAEASFHGDFLTSAAVTVMLPLRRCARSCTGRVGSVSGTRTRSGDWLCNNGAHSRRITIAGMKR